MRAYEAYLLYIERRDENKKRYAHDLESILKSLDMYETDVIRNHDGTIGQFRVLIPKTPWYDPRIVFFRQLSNGDLSKLQSGRIPYKDTEEYLQKNFIIRGGRNDRD